MIPTTATTVAVADPPVPQHRRETWGALDRDHRGPPAPAHSGSGARHHTGSANPDGRRLVEDDFAAATAAFLNKLGLDGTIERLVVVSDPRTLGEMRKHFHRDLRGKIRRAGEGLQPASVRGLASLIADA
jgi:hypothetical protein